MKQVIVVTGASSGFGALAARALVHAGVRPRLSPSRTYLAVFLAPWIKREPQDHYQ